MFNYWKHFDVTGVSILFYISSINLILLDDRQIMKELSKSLLDFNDGDGDL